MGSRWHFFTLTFYWYRGSKRESRLESTENFGAVALSVIGNNHIRRR